jgi:hypothetical protein
MRPAFELQGERTRVRRQPRPARLPNSRAKRIGERSHSLDISRGPNRPFSADPGKSCMSHVTPARVEPSEGRSWNRYRTTAEGSLAIEP